MLSSEALPPLEVLSANLFLELYTETFPSQRQFCNAVVLSKTNMLLKTYIRYSSFANVLVRRGVCPVRCEYLNLF